MAVLHLGQNDSCFGFMAWCERRLRVREFDERRLGTAMAEAHLLSSLTPPLGWIGQVETSHRMATSNDCQLDAMRPLGAPHGARTFAEQKATPICHQIEVASFSAVSRLWPLQWNPFVFNFYPGSYLRLFITVRIAPR